MKIVVNTRLLLPNRLDGIGWFTYETLKRITTNHPEHQFYFLFDRSYDEQFIFNKNVEPIVIGPPARHPFLFYLWFEFSVARILKKIQPDLFLSPDGYLSLNSDTPQLAVIHDINFHHFPKDLPFLVRKYYNYFFPRFAQKATRIATVSQFSKTDISQSYQINPQKIDVVYNGVNEKYGPINEIEQEKIRQKFTKGKQYFLFVGTLLPRKNLVHLMTGFDWFRKNTDTDIQLLIIGNKKWWTNEMENTYQQMQFANQIIFQGYTMPEDLHKILGSAKAMIFVPYFEGFGIPITESMKCATPVITSDASSTAEVGQDAALLVDPYNTEAIGEAMQQIVKDEQLRQKLIQKGIQRANDFSWDKTSDLLWKSILKM